MPLNDLKIVVIGGGLGRRNPSEDMICGLVTTGIAVTSGLQLNTSYELKAVEDLEALLVDAAYDTANKTLLYYHVTEFFRKNSSGTLWIRVAAQTVTLANLGDNALTHAKQLLIDANGKIRTLGISRNPETGYTPTLSGGLDGDVLAAIPKAQELAVAERAAHRPVHVVIEGRSFNGTATSATDLRTLNAELVSVCIAQDRDVAAIDALYAGHAAIGTVLGTISFAKVHENISWVRQFPLTSQSPARFINVGLSSGVAVSGYSDTALDTLNDKGFIFARSHTDFVGFWWNDSATCTELASDFAYIENVRPIQKAARLIRKKQLPDLGSPLKVDAATGKLDATTCKYFEATGNAALDKMLQDGEIVSKTVYVDPDQNVLSTSKLVEKFKIVPYGVTRELEGQIGYDNPLNS